MKSLVSRLSLFIALFMGFGTMAQNVTFSPTEPTGVTFFSGSWKDVLAEAKRQNRPVFVDIYTTWCPPCKRMANEAFPNLKVGAKFNVHFINYQLDAEKGEGVQVAKQYGVSSYPTALYIAPNAALVHRAVGYSGINGMIDQANTMLATPQLRTTVAKGDKDYAAGRRDPAFLKKYVKTRQLLERPSSDVLDTYLDALPESDRSTNETMLFVAEAIQSSTTKAFDYLIKNRSDLLVANAEKRSLATTVSDGLYRALDNDFRRASATNDEILLETVIANSERNTTSANPLMIREETQTQEAANDYRLRFLKRTQNSMK
ncbi:thioredoxin family protein [Spirosoma flavum]|uniref:Thioredoxin family protein n=1 Tax=Spirosoma flavum TaxID=2048557 RepID=A0ABW6AG49_9BACT